MDDPERLLHPVVVRFRVVVFKDTIVRFVGTSEGWVIARP